MSWGFFRSSMYGQSAFCCWTRCRNKVRVVRTNQVVYLKRCEFSHGFSRAESWSHGNLCPKAYQHMLPTNTHIWRLVIFWLGNALSCVSFQELCTAQCLYICCMFERRTSHPNFHQHSHNKGPTLPKASQKPYTLPETNSEFKPLKMDGWKTCLYWDAIVIAIITTKMHRQETPPRSTVIWDFRFEDS